MSMIGSFISRLYCNPPLYLLNLS